MAKNKRSNSDSSEVGSGAPHGDLSEDTAVHAAHGPHDLFIMDGNPEMNVSNWGTGGGHGGAKEFKVGGTVDGNAPFNVEPVHEVSQLMSNFNSSDELQDQYILKSVVDGIGLVR
jgi:hypothetical protein